MKHYSKVLTALVATAALAMISVQFSSSASSNGSGAPQGRTGSPADGANCTGCHAGMAVSNTAGLITSNIPTAGYTPGATYTITATISSAGINKFGFQVSPQKTNGTKVGTLVVTNSTQTQLLAAGKYITHKTAGTVGAGTKTWTFDWTAPVAGTGSFTFYGAFLSANGNNNDSGDKVTLSSMAVNENTSTVIADFTKTNNWNVFPNPCKNAITVDCTEKSSNSVEINFIDVSGRIVKSVKEFNLIQKQEINVSDLSNGMYVLKITTESGIVSKKIIKK